eukprot:556440_1
MATKLLYLVDHIIDQQIHYLDCIHVNHNRNYTTITKCKINCINIYYLCPSNNPDESKHTTSSSNNISITNTTNTTPNTNSITHNNIENDICNGHNRNIPISSRIHNPFSSNIAPNNNKNITEDIYASPPHKTCIKPTDTLPIFHENGSNKFSINCINPGTFIYCSNCSNTSTCNNVSTYTCSNK